MTKRPMRKTEGVDPQARPGVSLHTTVMKPMGEYVRELRESKDLSVRELAKRLRLSAPFLSDVELGRRHPSGEVLARLARELGTTATELRRHDARAPIPELRRMAANNPVMGFALRQVVEDEVDPDDLLRYLRERKAKP